MKTYEGTCVAPTTEAPALVDITDRIAELVGESGVDHGRVTILTGDTGATLFANERESGLLADVKQALERMKTNGSAAAPLLGAPSLVLPIIDGALALGTWQRVFLVELEAPRDCAVTVQVVGE